MTKELRITQKIPILVVSCLLLIYPLFYVPIFNGFTSYSYPRLLLLSFFSIFGILYFKNFIDKKILSIFVILNIVFAVIQIFNPREDELIYTIIGVDDRTEGVFYQILLMSIIPILYLGIKNTKSLVLYYVICITILTNSILMIHQYSAVPIEFFGYKFSFLISEVAALTGRSGFAAGLLIPLVFTIFSKSTNSPIILKVLTYLCIYLGAFAINLTQNRSSIFAFILTSIIFAILNYKKIFLILTLILCNFLVLYGIMFLPINPTVNRSLANTQTFETRIEIWKIAANLLPKSWLFPFWGGGTGEFKLLISDTLPYQELYKFLKIEYVWQPADQIKKTVVLTAPSTPKREKAFIFFYKDGSQEFTKITLDRAHNFFLDKAFSGGLIGVILWMIFYLYPIFAFFRLKPYQRTFEQQTLTMALLALQMYYIFWFSVMQVEPIHVVVALMAWVGIERAKATPDPQQKSAAPLEDAAPALNA